MEKRDIGRYQADPNSYKEFLFAQDPDHEPPIQQQELYIDGKLTPVFQLENIHKLFKVTEPRKLKLKKNKEYNIWQHQKNDPVLNPIIRYLKTKNKYWLTVIRSRLATEVARGNFKVTNYGLIYQNITDPKHNRPRLVIPKNLVLLVIKMVHKQLKHLKDIEHLIKEEFYWPNINATINLYCRHCKECQIVKGKPDRISYHLSSKQPTRFNQVVSIDAICPLPDDKYHFRYIQCILDHYTNFMILEPSYTVSDKEISEIIRNRWIHMFGPPDDLISDNGSGYYGPYNKALSTYFHINRVTITPGNSQALGQNEVKHRYIGHAIAIDYEAGIYTDSWSEQIKSIQYAYNCSNQRGSSFSPYELVFIREPPIFFDRTIRQTLREVKDLNSRKIQKQEIERLQAQQKFIKNRYKLYHNQFHQKKEQEFNKLVNLDPLQEFEPVMIFKKFQIGNTRKYQSRWEPGWKVVHKMDQRPVYKLYKRNKDGNIISRNEHRCFIKRFYDPNDIPGMENTKEKTKKKKE